MNESEQIQKTEKYMYKNRCILGYPTQNGQVRITQLISSDPADYLRPEFSPGMVVNAKKL